MVRVLFVCMGNICRSPMAEGVFQHLVNQAGLGDKIKIDSAGTSSYHVGEPAHHGTLKVLKQYNIPYNGRSRTLTRSDFDNFDYILAMDRDNLENMRISSETKATVKLFMEYADNPAVLEVPDPYYTGGFDHVYTLIESAARGLLQTIRTEHGL